MWMTQSRTTIAIQSLVEEVVAAGQMNRIQHFQLASALLSDPALSEKERRQINRAFDYIQTGRVQLIN